MRKLRKALIVLLCAIMLAGSLSVTSQAAVIPDSTSVQPRYIVIAEYTADIDISNTGRTTNFAKVVLDSSTHTGTMTMYLQRYGDYGWETVKSWTKSSKYSISMSEPWYVFSGYTYRVCANTKVYDSSGNLVENAYLYSIEIYY